MLNTTIGILLSRHSATAAASITLRSSLKHLAEGHAVVALRVRNLLRVGGVDAVDAGALEQGIAAHLGGAQRGGGVGCEIGIAGARGEQDDPALFQMPQRAAADVRLGHAGHRDRRQHAGVDAKLLQRILQRQRVHHRRQHAHVIGGGAVEALGRRGHAAEDVAAADDEAQLVPLRLGRGDLAGEAGDGVGIDAELALPHQRFARQLEQDAVEARAGHAAGLSSRCEKGGPAFMARAAPLPTAKRQLCCLRDRFGLRRAGGGSDFGGEVFLLLLDAFAELEADEARQLIRVPASLAADATTSATGVLPSITNSCDEQRIFLAELGEAALDHLLDDVLRLAAFLRLFHRDRTLALDQRRRRARPASSASGWAAATCIAICLPSAVSVSAGRRALERDQHADLAEARRDLVVDVGHDRALR